ncbi:sodium/proline symporter PutP [uncultured Tessaracoccus sp.]|uniref:sodium/proline symporter PutP n=1 Tax=uncultured Tessaracoccus sp. TaxID=905023 RepID=UPI0025EB035A|nr:sodium/proline symporter PutP [uncultured Tessaracoccus sp.]
MTDTTYQIIAMVIYMIAMLAIGWYSYRKTQNLNDYMLGGRDLHPAVAALSAGAADMSGWLLMGLPGAVYATGLVEGWIAVGLTLGAWCNWKIVAPRLRAYTQVANDSITVPSFLENRLKDRSRMLRIVSGLIILAFFTFYVSSGMVAGGVFMHSSFGLDYRLGMVIVAVVTILYTLFGGFLAVSYTDFVQGMMMAAALVAVPIVGIITLGGFGETGRLIGEADAVAGLDHLAVLPRELTAVAIVGIISSLAWGLGYFGQPHIIVRFMALRSTKEAIAGRRIGVGWMLLAVVGALSTSLIGVAWFQREGQVLEDPETVYIRMGQILFHPLIAGFMLAAVLAAIMSTVSSQLIVTSSALVEDVTKALSRKERPDHQYVFLGRAAVLVVALVAAAMAWTQNDTILALVAFAWAGFGASFGPSVLLSLFWRRFSTAGALASMVTGAVIVGVWGNVDGGIFDLYELLPGFLGALFVGWVVSLATHKPHPEVEREFDEALEVVQKIKE